MSDRRFVSVKAIVVASALAFLIPVVAAAQAVSIELTAVEVFDPLDMLGNGPVGDLTPGTVKCPGAQPTGDPMQPCPPGSRMRFGDVAWTSRLLSSSALLTGWFHNVGNNAFDANATGQLWGTFRIELDAGGAWHGSFTADRSKMGDVWLVRARGNGRGVGGAVDGMHSIQMPRQPLPFCPAARPPTRARKRAEGNREQLDRPPRLRLRLCVTARVEIDPGGGLVPNERGRTEPQRVLGLGNRLGIPGRAA